MHIGNIECFPAAKTISSSCNNLLSNRFLKTETIGLNPKDDYSGNVKCSTISVMRLVYKEKLMADTKYSTVATGKSTGY